TVAPASTTVAPAATTVAPASTTVAPAATTVAPAATTVAPAATTVAPAATTVAPAATTLVASTKAATSAATTSTTAPTTTTTAYKGRCGQYRADDGTPYTNRCVTRDTAATCSMDTTKPYCTCTAGWTDKYCTVDTNAFYNLGGNGTDKLIEVIRICKTSPAHLIASLPVLLSFLTDEQRMEMSYKVEEMILDASYEEKKLNIRDSFTLFNDPSLGNCFTFNHFNSTSLFKARGPGARYGMHTYIHPIGQNVYIESVKHTIRPGSEDQLAMKMHRFTRLHGLFSHCAKNKAAAQSFYFSGDYSVDGCFRSCHQDSVYASCGCMDPSYSRKQGVKACKFEQLACIDAMSVRRGDPYYWPECKCPQPCQEEEYRYETSKAMQFESRSTNSSRTSEVKIFFVMLEVYVNVEEWTFPFSEMLGQIGGFAGVLLGICVVFVIELFLLVVRICSIG
ncbi:hypothetical protein PENTCL1PPCAC_13103, partial [Pristionchus entomophagus]